MSKSASHVIVKKINRSILNVGVSDSEWRYTEQISKLKIDYDTRKKLQQATDLFASCLLPADSVVPLRHIQTAAANLLKRARILRNKVWKKDSAQIAKDEREMKRAIKAFQEDKFAFQSDFVSLVDRYFNEQPTALERQRPTAFFDRVLKGSELIVHCFMKTLAIEAAQMREKRYWFLWAALVFAILRESGIAVKHPKKNQLLAGPVIVLDRLQSKLPKTLQRRKTDDSFRKGAVIAWKIKRGIKSHQLRILLNRWTTADFQERKPLGIEWFLGARISRLAGSD